MVRSRALLVLLPVLLATLPASAQLVPMEVDGGRVVLQFLEGALEQADLELLALEESAPTFDPATEAMSGALLGFGLRSESDLVALRNGAGDFQPYGILGGALQVAGGFVLHARDTGLAVDFNDFRIAPVAVRNDGPGGEPDPDYFYLSTAAEPWAGAFQLCYVKILFSATAPYDPPAGDPGDHEQGAPVLVIKAFDLIVTPWLAERLGRPDLLGRVLATGKVEADVSESGDPWELPPGQNVRTPFTPPSDPGDAAAGTCCNPYRDVKLGILNSIKQTGHVGTWPNGRTGMSMATTSCNVGDENVPWLQPMNENHPGIAMGLYRELDGRFEQVGVSWIKHGFFALSNSQCTTCQNPSGGTFLGVGCSDTYGTSNNSDPFYLGPRSEWDPFTAAWTCLGSYFDGTPADCVRSEFGNGVGAVNHRLEAFDADLGNPGATYYYEAMYLVREDADVRNNIGSRLCTMSWNGSSWTFTTPSANNPLVEGPAVERWGEMHAESGIGDEDGTVVLAVDTSDLGNGLWRYEYALFNWNAKRRPGAFSVPVQGPVSAVTFHDVDGAPENDWQAVVAGNQITWTFPDVFVGGHKEAGPLQYGTLYNFGFTSPVPPADRTAAIDLYDPGPGGRRFPAATKGPAVLGLSASDLSPAVGQTTQLVAQGGSSALAIAVLDVEDISIDPPLLLGPVPFVGGQASIPVTIPPEVAGFTFTLVAIDYDPGTLQILQLSNLADIAVE